MTNYKLPIMLLVAALFGAGALIAGARWAASVRGSQPAPVVAVAPAPVRPVATVVVAAAPLRYGAELTPKMLKEIAWPADEVPAGAYKTIPELLDGKGRRIVLAGIEPNEPVLSTKVTGAGQRGTLSVLLEDGMGAVTVPTNEVVGVAGFVLPGDRVDVFLTRRGEAGAGPQAGSYSDVVLQNVRVLAVGQMADDRAEKPAVVSAVTLEVDQRSGQKLALAAASGSLTLMLRKAGDTSARDGRRVVVSDIGHQTMAQPSAPVVKTDQTVQVGVTRGMKREQFAVPSFAQATTSMRVVESRVPAP
jgi:pilus assembly protein CpaB